MYFKCNAANKTWITVSGQHVIVSFSPATTFQAKDRLDLIRKSNHFSGTSQYEFIGLQPVSRPVIQVNAIPFAGLTRDFRQYRVPKCNIVRGWI
jgi:hypothetical protein